MRCQKYNLDLKNIIRETRCTMSSQSNRWDQKDYAIHQLFPLGFENLAGIKEAETLDDMKGFGVNFFKDYLAKCPMAYKLRKNCKHGVCTDHIFNDSKSMCINMNAPNSNGYSYSTNPVIIFLSALVYFPPPHAPNFPKAILYRNGMIPFAFFVLGKILLIIVVRKVSKLRNDINSYQDVLDSNRTFFWLPFTQLMST